MMKKSIRRITAAMVGVVMLASMVISGLPTISMAAATAVSAQHYSDYTTISGIPNLGGCPSMQGFDVDTTYMYCAKINTDTEIAAIIVRTNKDTGEYVYMKNSATGTNIFSQIAHANDLAVTDVGSVKTMFVATGGAGIGDYSLVRFVIDGTTMTEVGHYNAKYNGTEQYLSGVKVVSVNDTEIELIFKKGKYIYTGKVGVNDTSGDIALNLLCTLDYSKVTVNSQVLDLSSYIQQGFGYADDKIFVPLTGDSSHINDSIIVVYDIKGVSGSITNDPTLSFRITSSTYQDLFEIESCAVSSYDGRLYFSTNRRITRSDANHDGVHYINNYLYNPARGETNTGNYRWEVSNDELVSVTDDSAIFNQLIKHGGSISGGTFTGSRHYMASAVVLKHNLPWILEWKSTGAGGGTLLMSSEARSHAVGSQYIYRRKGSSVLAFGEYANGQYNNYGLDLSDYGIDGSAEHVYSFRNRIASDGSNMIYLFVDGKEIAPMNQYFLGGTAQGTTSNWVSGKDFTFSYLGTVNHPINNCNIEYIQVWGNGVAGQVDEPDYYRWETKSNALTNISEFGLTPNGFVTAEGSCSAGVFTDSHFSLEREIVLLHDQPWSVEWQSDSWAGGGMLLSATQTSKVVDATYLYRSGIIGFGYYDGANYQNYGVKLSDHSIDSSTAHTYRLTNRIAADGSNMVYLFVDGKEIGAMNNYFLGTTAQGQTSDWVSGKDFTFGFVGTLQFPIHNAALSYLQVWESGIPDEHEPVNYRWETNTTKVNNISSDGFAANPLTTLSGSISNSTFTNSYFRMEKTVVLSHDKLWSIEWESEGTWKENTNGAMLLAASNTRNAPNAPYLYRRHDSTFIALGERRDGNHQNYGVSLSGHGIDGSVAHVYRLANRIEDDGSNMVYLFVDGKEIGPMNEYFIGGTAQGTTSNWVSGKDFTFSYIGNSQFPIGACTIDYLQISEGCVHSFGQWEGPDATCTADGTKTRTCSNCGYVQTKTITAAGHSFEAKVTAATCTQDGFTTYACVCGESYVADRVSAAGHQFSNGVCSACGEPEIVLNPTLTAKYPSLSIEDEVVLNVYFTFSDLGDISLEDFGLITWSTPQSVGTIETAEAIIEGAVYDSKNGVYTVHTQGIPAKKLGDTIYFKIYARLADGSYVYTSMLNYSPKTYAYSMLDGSDDAVKPVIVAMLNYGAAAQMIFEYKMYSLVNAGLTDAQKALVSAYDDSMVSGTSSVPAAKQGAFARTTTGFSAKRPSVSVMGAFAINYNFTPNAAVAGDMKLYVWDQATYDSNEVLTAENAIDVITMTAENGVYTGTVSGIAAKELDVPVYVAGVYTDASGNTYSTGVLAYSVSAYCKTMVNDATAAEIAQAIAVYGYYAKNYFAK